MNKQALDFLELCQYVSSKQAFSIRNIARYSHLRRLCKERRTELREALYKIWDDDNADSATEEAFALQSELDRLDDRIGYCSNKIMVLIRYAEYFAQIPFRLLNKEKVKCINP